MGGHVGTGQQSKDRRGYRRFKEERNTLDSKVNDALNETHTLYKSCTYKVLIGVISIIVR